MNDLPPIVPILLQLLDIPSPTGREKALCDWVEDLARRAANAGQHLEIERSGDGLVVRGPRQEARLHLVLLGHLDTVPAPEGLVPRLDGDRVVGRGTADMKAGLAVMIGLLEGVDLDAAQVDLTWVFYPREEGFYDLNGLAEMLRGGMIPLDADLYVLLEPTHGQLQLGCLGSVSADVVFRGTAAHAARPWLGRNAISKAGRWLLAMDRRRPRAVEVRGLTFRETYQVTMARGGVAQNVVPDEFTCRVNHRFAPGVSLDRAVRRLEQACSRADEVVVVDRCPAARPCPDNPLLDWMREVMRLSVHPKQAWTDVARLSAAGLEAANYGPGEPELAHQDDEHILVDDLQRFYIKMNRFLSEGRGRRSP